MQRFRPLIALAMAGLLLAGCGDDSSSDAEPDSASDAPETTSAPTDDLYGDTGGTTEAPDTTEAPEGSGEATLAVADVEGVGEALVGPDGRTLYLFDQDDGTTSACTGGCLDVWPALAADGEPVAGDGVDDALLEVADGAVPGQVVYNGHLLYYFSGDAGPGEANGIEIPSWFPVDASGDAIGT